MALGCQGHHHGKLAQNVVECGYVGYLNSWCQGGENGTSNCWNQCSCPHDIQEVLKVRLSVRAPEDHVMWFYEKSKFFFSEKCLSLGYESGQR
jgi:hypothetical protein